MAKDTVLATLASAHEQAAVASAPILDQQAQDLAYPKAAVSQHQNERSVPGALQAVRTGREHGLQLVVGVGTSGRVLFGVRMVNPRRGSSRRTPVSTAHLKNVLRVRYAWCW